MKIERVQKAAEIRGIYFEGKKRWLNNTVGFGYAFYTPREGYFMSGTLEGAYRKIMEYPKVKIEY